MKFKKNVIETKNCLDNKCFMTCEDRQMLQNLISNLTIKHLSTSITMRDIENALHRTSEYIVIDLYMIEKTKSIKHIAKFLAKIHIVDDLKTNLLIDIDVMKSQKMKIDLEHSTLIIDACKNLVVSINTIAKSHSNIKRTIRARHVTTISSHFTIQVSITY